MSVGEELVRARSVDRSARAGGRAHSPRFHRFRIAFATLVIVCLVSLGVAVALSSHGRTAASSSTWSAWSPPDGGLQGAQEIADYLAPYYRATPSNQLAVVTVVDLNNPAHPLQVVVPANGSSGALVPLNPTGTVVYNLCGTGSGNCSIGVGTPSSARLTLLRREALELALYTFKYISGTQTVVAILPPGHTTQGCTGICTPQLHTHTTVKPLNIALAFDRSELKPWLDHPLRQTLPEEIPPTVAQMPSAPEAELVSVITAHGLFSEHVEQAQDGSSVIVLTQLPPQ